MQSSHLASHFKMHPLTRNNGILATQCIDLFQDRLHDLSHHRGIQELVPNEFNVCSLALNDNHRIHINYSVEDMQIQWTSAIASVAFKNANVLFSTMLAIHLDWKLMQDGFFALDEVTKGCFLSFS